jgi:hypothetical protein
MTTGFDNSTDPRADCGQTEYKLDDEGFKQYYYSNGDSNEGAAAMAKGGNKFKNDISAELIFDYIVSIFTFAYEEPMSILDFFFPRVRTHVCSLSLSPSLSPSLSLALHIAFLC